ncbi:hypothetical protein PSECIP111951_02714 [Pseudoalteromonas holothuriae]|uniref:Uncharacterized protein n=1 Tax=Pseudoalteromonas holothuriae TaxID=2963714 RepID=A0A9W4QVU0_9GAMM|nr:MULTISPECIES: hypothetical protein [unclassified Pseudoalteromonas]CAH9055006.1 hypothetical protein PSECIP111854_01492 [Pseudoalteromonas sp. CIP111854]CAH9062548.1 hypothetical protein PSECIP111951_02714 [Pseudoalteromonas sp. CIP111951]
MRFETELATTFDACNTFYTFEKFAEILSPQLLEQLSYFKLPPKRDDRRYRRWVKPKASKYPTNKNANQLN